MYQMSMTTMLKKIEELYMEGHTAQQKKKIK